MAKSWDLSLPSLCKKFENYFKIGNIISPHELDDPALIEMYKHHYNTVTSENAMKSEHISSAPGVYDFSEADRIVNWAAETGLYMVGHAFCWHGQSARWLNMKEDGSSLPRAEAKANLEAFIKTYASRYKGKIYSWDVINEAFIDKDDGVYSGNWRDYIRRETDNPRAVGYWFLAYANGATEDECGSDYVFDAFYFARKYDPNAVLYYNEYNEEFNHKCVAIPQMVDDINKQWREHADYDGRLLIEGIGMQGHYNHRDIDIERIRTALERFAKTGAKISVTEMDFTFGSSEELSNPLTPDESKMQAKMYTELFKLYMEYSKHIERVTFWGKKDQQSWRKWGSPLLFDTESQAKEAFHAVVGLV